MLFLLYKQKCFIFSLSFVPVFPIEIIFSLKLFHWLYEMQKTASNVNVNGNKIMFLLKLMLYSESHQWHHFIELINDQMCWFDDDG